MDRRAGSVQALSNGHLFNNSAASPSRTIKSYAANTNSKVGVNGEPSFGSSIISPPILVPDQSPRQRAFLEELRKRNCKIVQVTYDRGLYFLISV